MRDTLRLFAGAPADVVGFELGARLAQRRHRPGASGAGPDAAGASTSVLALGPAQLGREVRGG